MDDLVELGPRLLVIRRPVIRLVAIDDGVLIIGKRGYRHCLASSVAEIDDQKRPQQLKNVKANIFQQPRGATVTVPIKREF